MNSCLPPLALTSPSKDLNVLVTVAAIPSVRNVCVKTDFMVHTAFWSVSVTPSETSARVMVRAHIMKSFPVYRIVSAIDIRMQVAALGLVSRFIQAAGAVFMAEIPMAASTRATARACAAIVKAQAQSGYMCGSWLRYSLCCCLQSRDALYALEYKICNNNKQSSLNSHVVSSFFLTFTSHLWLLLENCIWIWKCQYATQTSSPPQH